MPTQNCRHIRASISRNPSEGSVAVDVLQKVDRRGSRRRMQGQAMTEYVVALTMVTLAMAPAVVAMFYALAAYYDDLASWITLPVP